MEKLSTKSPDRTDVAPPEELTAAQLEQVVGGLNPQPLPPYADRD
jgi:hypothetical protein